MPINKTEAQRHREVQDRPSWRRRCHICGREYYDSAVGPCPERGGRQICMYCCRMCENHYTMKGQIGQRCRAKDALRAAAKGRGISSACGLRAGVTSPSPSPTPPLSGEAKDGGRGTEDGKERSA